MSEISIEKRRFLDKQRDRDARELMIFDFAEKAILRSKGQLQNNVPLTQTLWKYLNATSENHQKMLEEEILTIDDETIVQIYKAMVENLYEGESNKKV